MKEPKLKPCPFCGNIPEIADYGDDGYMVVCNICGCMTRFFKRKIDCVNIWNTRKNIWICVKDRLPEIHENVLCILYPALLRNIGWINSNNTWDGYPAYFFEKYVVTHWQPLPAPPEAKCQ